MEWANRVHQLDQLQAAISTIAENLDLVRSEFQKAGFTREEAIRFCDSLLRAFVMQGVP